MVCTSLLAAPPARAADGKPELIQPGKLIVATDSTSAPFSMRTPSGELDGLEVRVMREICRRLGLEYEPVNITFDALLVGLMADQYDITSESMDITPARQKRVAFADGWLESGARIVTRKDTGIPDRSRCDCENAIPKFDWPMRSDAVDRLITEGCRPAGPVAAPARRLNIFAMESSIAVDLLLPDADRAHDGKVIAAFRPAPGFFAAFAGPEGGDV